MMGYVPELTFKSTIYVCVFVNETSNLFGFFRWRWVDVNERRYCGPKTISPY